MTTTRPKQLADGSSRGKNFYAACVRALDVYLHLIRAADAVLLELNKIPSTNGESSLSDNDSLVIALADFGLDDGTR
jgi:hypothetical protein